MQPLRDVLQNSCSTPLLKKQLTHIYEKLHRDIFYNRSRATVLCLDSELQTVEVIYQWSRGPGGPGRIWDPEVLGVLGTRGSQGSPSSRGPTTGSLFSTMPLNWLLEGRNEWFQARKHVKIERTQVRNNLRHQGTQARKIYIGT